jgi:hypothetical protein
MTNHPHARPFERRQRALSYWLSEDASRLASPLTPSALRDMAWNRGQYRGLATACLGVGAACVGASFVAVAAEEPAIPAVGLMLAGIVLLVAGGMVRGRLRKRLVPNTEPVMASRAPGKLSSGIGMTVFLSLVLGVLLLPLALPLMEMGFGGKVRLVIGAVLFLLAVASLFAVPAYFMQHAWRDFRRDIAADPQLRSALEAMSVEWKDPKGLREFGPL